MFMKFVDFLQFAQFFEFVESFEFVDFPPGRLVCEVVLFEFEVCAERGAFVALAFYAVYSLDSCRPYWTSTWLLAPYLCSGAVFSAFCLI
jgi:hypothetical protein